MKSMGWAVLLTLLGLGCMQREEATGPRRAILDWRWTEPLGTGNGNPPVGCNGSRVGHDRNPSFATAATVRTAKGTSFALDCPPPSLVCTVAVAWNGDANCTLSYTPTNSTTIQWSFESDGGIQVDGPATGTTWSGRMVTSGTVLVDISDAGQLTTVSAHISVNRRQWSWASAVTQAEAALGVIDECMGNAMALMAGLSCTAANRGVLFTPEHPSPVDGYSASVVDDGGPNNTIYYISGASARADLRSQVNRTFRLDGLALPVFGTPLAVPCLQFFGNTNARNHDQVNNYCSPQPQFSSFVAYAWAHEALHMNAAYNAARASANDVYALWEPEVAANASQLQFALNGSYVDAHANVAAAALATHTGGLPQYTFWRYLLGICGGWCMATTTFAD